MSNGVDEVMLATARRNPLAKNISKSEMSEQNYPVHSTDQILCITVNVLIINLLVKS